MTDATARLALPFIAAGQAQKELFHNEALALLDALVQPAVEAVAATDPPAAPLPGQCWTLGAAPTGAWQGQAQALASWTEGGWRFTGAHAGMATWSLADQMPARFDGSVWRLGEIRAAKLVVDGLQVIGPRQPAIADAEDGSVVDSQARATLAAVLVMLRRHGLIET